MTMEAELAQLSQLDAEDKRAYFAHKVKLAEIEEAGKSEERKEREAERAFREREAERLERENERQFQLKKAELEADIQPRGERKISAVSSTMKNALVGKEGTSMPDHLLAAKLPLLYLLFQPSMQKSIKNSSGDLFRFGLSSLCLGGVLGFFLLVGVKAVTTSKLPPRLLAASMFFPGLSVGCGLLSLGVGTVGECWWSLSSYFQYRRASVSKTNV